MIIQLSDTLRIQNDTHSIALAKWVKKKGGSWEMFQWFGSMEQCIRFLIAKAVREDTTEVDGLTEGLVQMAEVATFTAALVVEAAQKAREALAGQAEPDRAT